MGPDDGGEGVEFFHGAVGEFHDDDFFGELDGGVGGLNEAGEDAFHLVGG